MQWMTADEWANWVLMGDPYAQCPSTLATLHDRIRRAVAQAVTEARMVDKIARMENVTETEAL